MLLCCKHITSHSGFMRLARVFNRIIIPVAEGCDVPDPMELSAMMVLCSCMRRDNGI